MRWLTSITCSVILGSGIALAGTQLARAADNALQAAGLPRRRNATAKQPRTLSDTRYPFLATAFRSSRRTISHSTREPSGLTRARNRRH